MEPLAILSVAAAAARLLDYGVAVFSEAREIWISSPGHRQRNAQLSKIERKLQSLTDDVDARLQRACRHLPLEGTTPSADLGRLSHATMALLCRECSHVADGLHNFLGKLKVDVRMSLSGLADGGESAVLNDIWSESKADRLRDRLLQLHSQTVMAVLVILRKLAEADRSTLLHVAESQVDLMRRLQERYGNGMRPPRHDLGDETTQKFGVKMMELVQGHTQESRRQAQIIVNHVLDSQWRPGDAMLAQAQETAKEAAGDDRGTHVRKILGSLMFGTMHLREESISPAHMNTFEWMFQTCSHDMQDASASASASASLWSHFGQWCSADSDRLFCITGKAGAGKSTLIRFAATDPRFASHLGAWAGTSELILATYFAWNAGDRLQKSREGLLRTILHQCLSTNPRLLVPIVFPARWSLLQVFSEGVALPPWTMDELMSGFRALVSHAGHDATSGYPAYKLALVVDGLDEFEVEQGNFQPLLQLIEEANQSPYVKICVSSRPWDVFRDAFRQSPMLEMEKLSYPDIRLYIWDKFHASPAFLAHKAAHPVEAERLLADMADKALGVFLWVTVVVRNLLQSVEQGDSLAQMRETLNSLPGDISQLFDVIWERIGVDHCREASQYFGIMECYERYNLTPLAANIGLGVAHDDMALDALGRGLAKEDFLADVVATLSRQLSSRTNGLLEVQQVSGVKNSVVGYMHRSTREWFKEKWVVLNAAPQPPFDENLWLLRGETLRLSLDAGCRHASAHAPDMFWERIGYSDGVWRHIEYPGGLWARIRSSYKFWEHVRRILQVSTQGGFKDPAALVRILDRLDSEVIRQSPVEEMSREIFWCPQVGGGGACERQLWEEWRPMSFVGFMAQIPVPHYLYAKISRDPGVLQGVGVRIRVLVNAIFGGFFLSPELYALANAAGRNGEMRQEVVRFLLNYTPVEEAQRALDLVRYHGGIVGTAGRGRADGGYMRGVEEMLGMHVAQNSREVEEMAGRELRRVSFLNRMKRIRT